ncbi:MAG: aminoglycoside phosphotransferase family protein [Chloroflexota bacterium]|nr:aminoglycoside phosphotransferase family protein [Chloroflexota bacterium]
MNQVAIVGLESGTMVLRANDGSDKYEFEKEAACLAAASSLGIPGPRVLKIGHLDGWTYMVEEFIPAAPPRDAPTPVDVWQTLGRYARTIHRIPVTGFGRDFAGDDHLAFRDTWPRFLSYNVTSLDATDPILDVGFTQDESDDLATIFERLRSTQFSFALCHGDLAPRNTVVANDGQVFLLDWGCAQANTVPHFDLSQVLRAEVHTDSDEFDAFLDGYGLTRAELDAQTPSITALAALCQADLLRWSIDRAPESIPHYADQLRRSLKEAIRCSN